MEICTGNTDLNIRSLKLEEAEILKEFLYDAIFVPEGMDAPPMEIILQPELQVYIRDFGKKKDDIAFLAESEGKVIGAVWVRIMNDYGHIDDETPSFAISVKKEFRGKGIGTKLMQRMLSELKRRGYKQASLSVQKQNHAVNLYKRLGFRTVGENEEEFIMVYRFRYTLQNEGFDLLKDSLFLRRRQMSGKTARIIAWIMLITAVCFVGYACAHPEASFPWRNQKITYGLYVIYIVSMIVLFALSLKKK